MRKIPFLDESWMCLYCNGGRVNALGNNWADCNFLVESGLTGEHLPKLSYFEKEMSYKEDPFWYFDRNEEQAREKKHRVFSANIERAKQIDLTEGVRAAIERAANSFNPLKPSAASASAVGPASSLRKPQAEAGALPGWGKSKAKRRREDYQKMFWRGLGTSGFRNF